MGWWRFVFSLSYQVRRCERCEAYVKANDSIWLVHWVTYSALVLGPFAFIMVGVFRRVWVVPTVAGVLLTMLCMTLASRRWVATGEFAVKVCETCGHQLHFDPKRSVDAWYCPRCDKKAGLARRH